MTDNTTNKDEADGSDVLVFGSADEQAGHPDELTETDNFPDEPAETDDDDPAGKGVLGAGAVSGGFGFAGLALAVVSLTTNWTSGIVVSHGQYNEEIHATGSGMTAQQQLNMYANGWHTQGWWAFLFAAAAVLSGTGALLVPGILRRGDDTPGWARAAATGAIIAGLVGVLLAVLTITGVFGGHLTAPASTSAG